jgi:phage recombination protein Bet
MDQAVAVRPLESSYLIPQALKDIYMKTVFAGLSEDEAVVAYRLAKRRNLDVEAKQIFFVPYTDKQGRRTVVSQTSIDGFRLIASKSGKYGGSVNPKLTVKYKDGSKAVIQHEEYDPSETERIISGTISVINTDFPQPQSATALFDSYCKKYNGNPSGLWATMPDVMILKCAEALALRKAFPQDLSGIYTSDEMEQAKNDESFHSQTTVAAPTPVKKQSLKDFKSKKASVETEETIEVIPENKPAEPPVKQQTIAELVASIPDGLRKMNPEIDEDVFDACTISILNEFGVEVVSDIPEDRYEDVRQFMRTNMIEMLKTHGYLS